MNKIRLTEVFKIEDATKKVCKRYSDKTSCRLAVNKTLNNYLKDRDVNYSTDLELIKPLKDNLPISQEIIQRVVKKSLAYCNRSYPVPITETRFNKKMKKANDSCQEGTLNFADELEKENLKLITKKLL